MSTGSSAAVELPSAASLAPELRKIVLAGVKFLLARLRQNKLIEQNVQYRDILNSPPLMAKYIDLIRNNPEIGKDLMVDETGKPVSNSETPLVCGASLGQLERMLVYTCSSKIFIKPGDRVKKEEPKKKKFSLFGKKSKNDSDNKKDAKSAGEAKLEEIKPYLVFAWQLNLVEAYEKYLQREHYRVLKEKLLILDSANKVRTIGGVEPHHIANVQKLTEDRFDKILKDNPGAIAGMAMIKSKGKFDFIFKITGDRIWDFFARDTQYVAEIIGADEDRIWAIGPSIADLSYENLQILRRLKLPVLKIFMEVYREVFGKMASKFLIEDEFGPKFLKPIVEEFVELTTGDDTTDDQKNAVGDIMALKWDALKNRIAEWYKEVSSAETANQPEN